MRRSTALLAMLAAIGLGGCGDDDAPEGGAATGTTATATTTPGTGTAPTAPTAADQAVWPAPGSMDQGDPVAVARSFVTDYVGLEDPALSAYRAGEPRAGEVEVYRRSEDGRVLDTVVSVISLRQLDGRRWSVTSAQTDQVELETPETLDVVRSPLVVRGRGRGFEGNVVVELRPAFATAPLAREPVTAGSAGTLEPFTARLAFTPPDGTATGALLVRTGSGIAAADGFGALPLRFAP